MERIVHEVLHISCRLWSQRSSIKGITSCFVVLLDLPSRFLRRQSVLVSNAFELYYHFHLRVLAGLVLARLHIVGIVRIFNVVNRTKGN